MTGSKLASTPTLLATNGTDGPWYELVDEPGYLVSAPKVLRSGAGFYVGRMGFAPEGYHEPYSRESGYFPTEQAAREALATGFAPREGLESRVAPVLEAPSPTAGRRRRSQSRDRER